MYTHVNEKCVMSSPRCMQQQQFVLLLIQSPLLLGASNYQRHMNIVDSKSLPSNYFIISFMYQFINGMFDLLFNRTCCNSSTSILVFVKPANYSLNLSHTLKNLCNKYFISQTNDSAMNQMFTKIYSLILILNLLQSQI